MAKKLFISDLFTEFEFDSFSNSDTVDASLKLEYIKEMISFAKSDKQATFMYLAFALASAVFLIDKLDPSIQSAGHSYLVLFYIGITALLVSSIFFFTYWRKTHKCQMSMVSCIPLLNIEKTRNLWVHLWNENRRYFKLGLLLLSIGTTLTFTIILIAKFIS